ncbi:integrase catalytic domain-containing protein [Rhizobium leguminosarum]|uniref:integrase catalytic domain-containing protein n=1 Tax=Rhizobium leguminosarum TaxID=384 RepID=UPI0014416DC9|nr:DDE-type integrase/transposase/recombinase [Rhizobium leguminosarum]NKM95691.1 DDE-type integrase/transposase/recombinase [Rhizobium leguminosarum bv. viciae]
MDPNFRPSPSKQFFHSLVGMSPADRYECKETKENFIPLTRDNVGYLLQSETNAERKVFLSHSEIYAALDNKRADIHYGYNSPAQQVLRNLFGDKSWDEFDAKDRDIALYREQMVLMYNQDCHDCGKQLAFSEKVLESKLKEYTRVINFKLVEAAAQEGRADKVSDIKIYKRPSAKTFKRWHDRYHACDMDVMALLPRHHGPGSKLFAFSPRAVAFAHDKARSYLDRSRPKKADVYRRYLAALLAENQTLPAHLRMGKVSRKKFEAMISKFDAFHVVAARYGEKHAVKKFMAIRRSFTIVAPGQRIEMDFVNVDLVSLLVETGIWNALPPSIQEKIPRVRIYFGAAIDVATRYIVAFKASLNPNGAAAVAVIRMIMEDKRHLSTYVGAQTPWIAKLRPRFIAHDNGSEFIANRTQNVLRLSKIEANRPPAGQPTFRPFIERLFHTIGLLVAPYFDGRTFHNVVEKGDYDPQKHGSLLVEELIKVFILAICDIYHNKPHDGLGGNTPHNAWVDACKEYEIDFPPGAKEMLHIFGHATQSRVSFYGVTVMGITYDDPELQRLRRKYGEVDVPVKFDPECAAHILFKSDKGWFVARNTVGLDDDVTFAEWIVARKELRAHYDTAAEQGMKIMYEAINRLRATGEAASLRAGLSPRIPTAADFLKWEKELFGGWTAVPSDDAPLLHNSAPAFDDPLHIGEVMDRSDLFAHDRMEEPSDEQADNGDGDFADLNDVTSNFAQYEEDY